MAKRHRKPNASTDSRPTRPTPEPTVGLRIIGGRLRGRRLQYSGDPRTRPMKDRLREAMFNLLGPDIRGKRAIDLFAGTGALALEAISRGAARATVIEQHYPTADVIRQNAIALEIGNLVEIFPGNVFIWHKRGMPKPIAGRAPAEPAADVDVPIDKTPWVVFCSPPYEFYVSRTEEMLELIGGLMQSAPAESDFVVEADERFDFGQLPDPQAWDVPRVSAGGGGDVLEAVVVGGIPVIPVVPRRFMKFLRQHGDIMLGFGVAILCEPHLPPACGAVGSLP